MKKPTVIHPFLFALFPILFLFSHNVEQVTLAETLKPTVLVLSLTVLFFLLSWFIFNDSKRAALMVSIYVVAVFSYGPAFDVMQKWWHLNDLVRFRSESLLAWAGLFMTGAYGVIRRRGSFETATNLLNRVAMILVVIPLIHVGVYKLTTTGPPPAPQSTIEVPHREATAAAVVPDIYYIIVDRYGRADILKEVYRFDNSEFLTGLSRRGFYLAAESRSNYHHTAPSLACSLNMELLNRLRDRVGQDSTDLIPLFAMLQDFQVWRFLKARGYRYIHFGSWWQPTTENKYADLNVNLHSLPEFSRILYTMTICHALGVKYIQRPLADASLEQWHRVHYQFEKLAEIPQIKEPTFVFAHFLVPHDPFVFDQDGRFLTREEAQKRSPTENYVNQVIFINRKLTELIDHLLADSERPPIILVQSDEGPPPLNYDLDRDGFNWTKATDAELREKLGILNAYYLPGVDQTVLYPSITPVNSFRLLFNLYFNTRLELLPDNSYVFPDETHVYQFVDVTDRITKH
jgi:hypothetical protein